MSLNTEPAWYQDMLDSARSYWNNKSNINQNPQENSISLKAGPTEMLRVAEDGFYVRGKKLAVDDKEAETVYNAFSEWLNWQILNRKV